MANRIPQAFIDDLLIRTDIVALIDNRVPLRKRGHNYLACCPFHQEKSPSFSVSPNKQFYHCFGCGVSGNAISFLMEFDRLEFIPAIELLANQAGLQLPQEATSTSYKSQHDLFDLTAKAAAFYQQQLRLHPDAIGYLKNRGVSGQIAKQFGIGYAPAGWNHLLKTFPSNDETIKQLQAAGLVTNKEGQYYDRFRQRIMFPIKDRQGRIVGFGGRVIDDSLPKYLNSPETSLFHKGRELYGLYEARQQQRELECIVLVEGYMDVIALAQQGISYSVATLGTATTAEHLQQLFRCAPEVIFCFDGDRAGQTAAWRALEQALPFMEDGRQVRFMLLPEGEDPDSYVRKIGTAGFEEALAKATPLTDYLLNHLLEKVDINTVAGKARLAAQAKPLIAKMPANVLQHLLLEQLAQRMRIDVTRLKNLMRQKSTHKETSPQQRQKTYKALSPMQLVLALLLQNPQLTQAVDLTLLTDLQLPGSDLLLALVSMLKESSSDLTTGAILEHWRDQPLHSTLSRLAACEHLIPVQNQQQELAATLQHLQQLTIEAKINDLIAKAHQQGLTSEEKLQLQKLIANSKTKLPSER